MDTLLTEIMVLRELRKIAQKAGTQLLDKEYHDRHTVERYCRHDGNFDVHVSLGSCHATPQREIRT